MTVLALSVKQNKPYRGAKSFQTEDADLFFGRDRDAEELVSTILSNRLTLLHAQSASGKTSLLNARVMPLLEVRSWMPVRATPELDPVESVKQATLQHLLPPPESECWVIRAACRGLCGDAYGVTLGEVLAAYNRLPKRDPLRRSLIRRVRRRRPAAGSRLDSGGRVTPFFTRLLRGSIGMDRFVDHVLALTQPDAPSAISADRFDASMPVRELLEELRSDEVRERYDSIAGQITTYPLIGLRPFFDNFMDVWGDRHPRFAMVLVLDQFEELFTRFQDTRRMARRADSEVLDWRLRLEFFNELRKLYEGDERYPGDDAAPPTFPLRYVISIRDEYVAQLDPIRRMVPGLEESTFHLTLLEREQAEQAIRQPALEYGYDYEETCFRELVQRLTKEDRFVEPALLQMVCEKIWRVRGKELAQTTAGGVPARSRPLIGYEVLRQLGGLEGIVKSSFLELLAKLSYSDRFDVLDMLEPLITDRGTRNLAEWGQLTQRPFRRTSRRGKLLDLMVKATIIRVEQRPTGRLVEITHEFLIPAIQHALTREWTRSQRSRRLREALRTLASYGYHDFRSDLTWLLSPAEFPNLHASRKYIVWPEWATELMLRTAVSQGAADDVVREWAEQFDQAAVGQTPEVLEQVLSARRSYKTFSLEELRLINRYRDDLTIDPETVRRIFVSELHRSDDADEGDILYWTRRSAAHDHEHTVGN